MTNPLLLLATLLPLACSGDAPPTEPLVPVTPGARAEHTLVYDGARGHVLLFGGIAASDAGATFAFDGAQWRRIATTGPSARQDARMAYDAARQVVVLFGGRSGSTQLADTWEWDGTRWTQRATTGPAARMHAGMAYDAASQRVLLHGGFGAGAALTDTWSWDGTQWTRASDTAPEGHSVNAMTELNGRAVLASVYNAPNTPRDGNMGLYLWQWQGGAWIELPPSGVRFSPAMPITPTASASELLLYAGWDAPAGSPATTWLVGANGARSLGSAGPGRRKGSAAAYDARRGRVVLYGGENDSGLLADTWEYADGTWQRVEQTP